MKNVIITILAVITIGAGYYAMRNSSALTLSEYNEREDVEQKQIDSLILMCKKSNIQINMLTKKIDSLNKKADYSNKKLDEIDSYLHEQCEKPIRTIEEYDRYR